MTDSHSDTSRRLVCVQISQQFVEEILTTGYEITRPVRCIEGLPEGARLCHVRVADARPWDAGFCDVLLTFQHDSFAEVPVGESPPLQNPVFQTSVRRQSP